MQLYRKNKVDGHWPKWRIKSQESVHVCLCLHLSLFVYVQQFGCVDGRLYQQPTCCTEVTNHTMAGFDLPKSIIDDGIVLEKECKWVQKNNNKNRLWEKTKEMRSTTGFASRRGDDVAAVVSSDCQRVILWVSLVPEEVTRKGEEMTFQFDSAIW